MQTEASGQMTCHNHIAQKSGHVGNSAHGSLQLHIAL